MLEYFPLALIDFIQKLFTHEYLINAAKYEKKLKLKEYEYKKKKRQQHKPNQSSFIKILQYFKENKYPNIELLFVLKHI